MLLLTGLANLDWWWRWARDRFDICHFASQQHVEYFSFFNNTVKYCSRDYSIQQLHCHGILGKLGYCLESSVVRVSVFRAYNHVPPACFKLAFIHCWNQQWRSHWNFICPHHKLSTFLSPGLFVTARASITGKFLFTTPTQVRRFSPQISFLHNWSRFP